MDNNTIAFIVLACATILCVWFWRATSIKPNSDGVASNSYRTVDEEWPRIKVPRQKKRADPLATLCILYADVEGELTERIITVMDIETYGGVLYLIAWCHLRKDRRKFRCDRIQIALENDTGARITDIHAYIMSRLPR